MSPFAKPEGDGKQADIRKNVGASLDVTMARNKLGTADAMSRTLKANQLRNSMDVR